MKSTIILSFVGVAMVIFIIGMALGSVAFPTNRTETATELSLVPVSVTGSLPIVTVTKVISYGYAEMIYRSGTCTQPTVGYSTLITTMYHLASRVNVSQGSYRIVFVTTNTTNFSPSTTIITSETYPCNPFANSTTITNK